MNRTLFSLIVFLTMILGSASAQELGNFANKPLVSPEVAGDSITFRLSADYATVVSVWGSWLDWGQAPVPMTKGPGGVWSATVGGLEPELYFYWFVVDGVKTLDPANVLMQRDGTSFLSCAIVDGERSAGYHETASTQHGTLSYMWYDSPTLGMQRRLSVYTPYGYEGGGQKYPVLYLLHGSGGDEDAWPSMGRTVQIMDRLIEQGLAKPMIVVMPNGNPWQQAAKTLQLPERQMDLRAPENADIYVRSLVGDIVPFIEKNFRVIAQPSGRAIAGLSMGGGHTIAAANLFPGFFQYICPLSMGIRATDPSALEDYRARFQGLKKAGYKLYWVGCGDADFLYDSACTLDAMLTECGLEHTYYVSEGGHTWANWRLFLSNFAPLLFK